MGAGCWRHHCILSGHQATVSVTSVTAVSVVLGATVILWGHSDRHCTCLPPQLSGVLPIERFS